MTIIINYMQTVPNFAQHIGGTGYTHPMASLVPMQAFPYIAVALSS